MHVGAIVHYGVTDLGSDVVKPAAAIVTAVSSDCILDLCVFAGGCGALDLFDVVYSKELQADCWTPIPVN